MILLYHFMSGLKTRTLHLQRKYSDYRVLKVFGIFGDCASSCNFGRVHSITEDKTLHPMV